MLLAIVRLLGAARMLKQVKKRTLETLNSAGVLARVGESEWRHRRLLIIGYHGVSLDDEHRWNADLYFSPAELRTRFEILRSERCAVLPLGEGLSRLSAGTLPPRAVVLTFDDGMYDFYAKAWPLLQEFGFPATTYPSTYYSAYQRPVFPIACAYLLWKAAPRMLDAASLTGRPRQFALGSAGGRAEAWSHLTSYADEVGLSGPEKEELLDRLALSAGVDYAALRARRTLMVMTPAELREIAEAGVDVQLHTHRHRTPDDRKAFLEEIETNRAALRQATGQSAVHFCYPSGVHKPAYLPWLREAGVASAVTCDPGFASISTDPLILPRLIDTSSLCPIEFRGWLTGVSNALPSSATVARWLPLKRSRHGTTAAT